MIWSFTALTQAERCMHAFRAKYITKTLPFAPSPAADYGVQVHKLMEKHVKDGAAFPPDFSWLKEFVPVRQPEQTHFAEMPLALRADGTVCGFWDKDCWFRGKADFLSLTPSSADAPAVAILLDWKTGKPLDDSVQLELSALCLFAHHPDVQAVQTMFVWLKECTGVWAHDFDCRTDLRVSRAQIPDLWAKIMPRAAELEQRHREMDFPPKPGRSCKWCPVQSCPFNGDDHSR